MSSATIRRDSSLKQLQKRVPSDIVARAEGRCYPITLPAVGSRPEELVEIRIRPVIKLSLRTSESAAAKTRVIAVSAQLDRIFASLRNGPVELTFKQAVALSGEIYRLVVDRFEANPGNPMDWEAWKAFHWGAMEGRVPNPPIISWRDIMNERQMALGFFGVDSGPLLLDKIESLPLGDSDRSLEIRFGLLASWVLARHRLEITPASRLVLLRQVAEAALDAGWHMKRASQGDYTPDPKANRFPSMSVGETTDLTLDSLFERWREESQPAASTIESWQPVLVSLKAHLQHQIVTRITPQDVTNWKNVLMHSKRKPKTINDTYLACLRALLSYGIKNHLLAHNVATGVNVKDKRVAGTGHLPYEDSEVLTILKIAARQDHSARRWIPLLLACTGARPGELAQLWGSRVREIDGVLAIELMPAEDGGSFKNEGSERTVPLHPALVEAGFLDFVCSNGEGPLFYGNVSGRGKRHASKGTVNHLAAWIRKQPGFQNPRKGPSKAFRHWWKSTASRVGISDSRANAIQGHKTEGEAATYRHFDLESLAKDVAKIPVPRV